jgi:hypothetical protein
MIPVDDLEDAPHYASEGDWNWNDAARTRSLNAYYGVPQM